MMDSKAGRYGRLAGCVAAGAVLIGLAACGEKKDPAAAQVVAKVNKSDITAPQVEFLLQQQRNLRPDQADAARRQIVERLIDQELAVQKAEQLKLDRDTKVAQQLELARRELLARAYVEKVGDAATKPTADEVKKYYDDKPALFAERRIYSLQEMLVEARADQAAQVRELLGGVKTMGEFAERLKSAGFRFSGNQAVRAAEQLPLQHLEAISKLKDGQAFVMQAPNGLQVLALAGSRTQSLTLEQARPFIEQYLLGERKRKLIDDQVKSARAEATISLVGKSAETAPAGTAPVAAGAEAASAASPIGTESAKGNGQK